MSKHTLGPWFLKKDIDTSDEWNAYDVMTSDKWAIAGINKLRDEYKANARLIAAAPDLLEALCDMVSDRDCLSEGTIAFAKKATAKARGE
jgi:hypothetical protein